MAKISWIDIQNPTPEDLRAIGERFNLPGVILKELEVPSVRARVEAYDDFLFFVYNFPVYKQEEQTSRRGEVDFVVTKDAVITVHYERLLALTDLAGFEAQNTFELVYNILHAIFNFEDRELRHIREKVEHVGSRLFSGREKEILRQISFLKRDISEYRIIVRSGENILNSLNSQGLNWWGNDIKVYLNDLAGEHFKIVNQIEDYRGAVDDFEHTNSQLMYAKTTDVMKTLTIFSFLTFPFMLFAAIFSMRVPGTPLQEIPYAFWLIVGAILTGMVSMAIFFHRKDWL